MKPAMQSLRQTQRGASLIEVLVSILLVALGILAMGAMQVNANRVAKTSEFRAMGALLVADLADRMRANRPAVFHEASADAPPANLYKFTDAYPSDGAVTIPAEPTSCKTADCTPEDMAAHDMTAWRRVVASALPGGWVRVSDVDTADQGVDIWLMWVDVNGTASSSEQAACPDSAAEEGDDEDPPPTVIPSCMYFRVNL